MTTEEMNKHKGLLRTVFYGSGRYATSTTGIVTIEENNREPGKFLILNPNGQGSGIHLHAEHISRVAIPDSE